MMLVVRFAMMTLIMAASLFLSAGRWDWPAGWALLVFNLAWVGGAMAVLLRKDPDLIAERTRGLAGAKSWDKFLSPFMALVGPVAMWACGGLEYRFRGAAGMPDWLRACGWVAAMAGGLFTFWAMLCNRFFSSVVRIQTDRGHRVQSGGPYGLVRHPGYVGASFFTLSVPLILDSRWALVPAAVTVVATVIRTALEDATLRRELDGYAEYAERTKYRLLPPLW